MSSNKSNFFINVFIKFVHKYKKCPKFNQLNIMKKIMKEFKVMFEKDTAVFLKKKKKQYRRERYKSLAQDEKKLVEYRKNIK